MLYDIYLKSIWKALMTYQCTLTPPDCVCNKNCGFEGSSKKKKARENLTGKLWAMLLLRPGLAWISPNPILRGPPLNHAWNLGCHFHKWQPNPHHSNAQSSVCTRRTCWSCSALCDRCRERMFVFTRSAVVVRMCGFRRLELISYCKSRCKWSWHQEISGRLMFHRDTEK